MPDQVTYELRGYRAEWNWLIDNWVAKKVYVPDEPVHGSTEEEAISKAKKGTSEAAQTLFAGVCFVTVSAVLIAIGFALNSLFIGVSWAIPFIVFTPIGSHISRGLWSSLNGK